MNNITSKLTALAVSVFIIFFGAASFAPNDKAVIPEFTWDNITGGSWGREFSTFAAQHFAFSDTWRSVGSRIDSKISGDIVNGVYIADDRLIAADISEREDAEDCSAVINSFAESYDGTVYFVAVPTSAGVYGDVLPAHLSRVTEKQKTEHLYEQLSSDIRRVDAYNLMKMLSDDRIYLRSDSKWTMYGAYCLYRTVVQKLGSQPVSYDKYTIRHVTDEYCGDLYRRTLYMKNEPDMLDIYEYADGAQVTECVSIGNDGSEHECSLYDVSALGSDDMYRLYLGEREPLVRVHTDVNNERRLLLIGSECAACFVPFLTQHYSEITVFFPEYADRPLKEFTDPNECEQTLFLLGIDSINSEKLSMIEMR